MDGMLGLLITEADENVREILRLKREENKSAAYVEGKLRKDCL